MNASILKRWIKRLRSGKYLQGRNCLKSVDSKGKAHYCCLGLLCLVHQRATGNGIWEERDGDWYYRVGSEVAHEVLPKAVVQWAGLTDNAVQVEPDRVNTGLTTNPILAATLNDGESDTLLNRSVKPHNFKQIADRLEEAARAGTLK